MSDKKVYKVGSRKSQLALIQTDLVIGRLREKFPDCDFKIVTMMTMGDKILDKPLPKIGEKSLFTKELETALEKNEVDFVVHSLKDLPTDLPPNLTIGAVLQREDPRDALILRKNLNYKSICELPQFSVIGTSSLRRCAQLNRNYPNVKVENIRGNLNTRLQKLDADDNKYSGIILAAAGVKRLKLENRITQILDPNDFLYAVGQGALAVECNINNKAVLNILEVLNHRDTILCILAERSFLQHLDLRNVNEIITMSSKNSKNELIEVIIYIYVMSSFGTIGGGCSAPVAVQSKVQNDSLCLDGAVWTLSGDEFLRKSKSIILDHSEPPQKISNIMRKTYMGITTSSISVGDLEAAIKLGNDLAEELISLGAIKIIQKAKSDNEK